MEMYEHTALPRPDHIRLLVIQTSRHLEDPIACKIVFAQPGSLPKYVAISYSWAIEDGDASPRCEILVKGKRFRLTQNLFDGLRRLRKKKGRLRVWADAICINQSDPEEKLQQVARMANVYRNASWTAIWLGEASIDDNAREIFRFFKLWSTTFADRRPWTPGCVHLFVHGGFDDTSEAAPGRCACGCFLDSMFQTWTSEQADEFLDKCMMDDHIVRKISERITEIFKFVVRRSWTRQRTLQELFASRGPVFLYGSCRFNVTEDFRKDATHLAEAMNALAKWLYHSPLSIAQQICRDIDAHFRHVSHVRMLFDFFRHDPGDVYLNALDALYISEDRQCADPRDKLYSLLSFDTDLRMLPDYTKTTAQVYTEFAVERIARGHIHWIFHTLKKQFNLRHSSQSTILPSCVPDLRLPVAERSFESLNNAPEFAAVRNGPSILCDLYVLGIIVNHELSHSGLKFQMAPTTYCRIYPITSETFAIALASNTTVPESTSLLDTHNRSVELCAPDWSEHVDIHQLDLVCVTRIDYIDRSFLVFLGQDPSLSAGFLLVRVTDCRHILEFRHVAAVDGFPWKPQRAIVQIN